MVRDIVKSLDYGSRLAPDRPAELNSALGRTCARLIAVTEALKNGTEVRFASQLTYLATPKTGASPSKIQGVPEITYNALYFN